MGFFQDFEDIQVGFTLEDKPESSLRDIVEEEEVSVELHLSEQEMQLVCDTHLQVIYHLFV